MLTELMDLENVDTESRFDMTPSMYICVHLQGWNIPFGSRKGNDL